MTWRADYFAGYGTGWQDPDADVAMAEHDAALARMDRLAERAPASRHYRGDELAAQTALRPYTGNVLPLGPSSKAFVPVDIGWEIEKNAAPGADTPRAA